MKKAVILFLSMLILPFSYADTLKGNKGVEILAIDGQKLKGGFLNSESSELAEGKHQVVVKYGNNFNNEEMIYSKPHIFNIDVIGETAISVRNFKNQAQAEKAIKQGLTWIVKNAKQTQEITGADILIGRKGFLPYKDIEKLIQNYNQKSGIHLASSQDQVMPDPLLADEENKELQQGKTEQLIQLYQSANKEQRKAFRIWLLEQDIK